jgi:spore coat protein U-like protein
MVVTAESTHIYIWIRKKKIHYKNYLQFSIYYHSTSAAVWADIHNDVTKRGTNVSRQMKESRRIGSSRMCIRRRFEEDAEMRRYK